MNFLTEPWPLLGIEAPLFSWLAAIALIIWPAYELLKLFIGTYKHSKLFEDTTKKLTTAKNRLGLEGGRGLPVSALDQIAALFKDISNLNSVWEGYRKQFIRFTKDGNDEFYASESAGASFSEESVIDSQFNKRFISAIPGIVTSTGLLFTFLAILVALMDVKIVDNRVEGLKLLIEGLSGKFVSSVSALFSATFFLICEKSLFHRLSRKRKQLVMAVDALIPRLTTNQVMANIQNDISEQTDAFRLFNSDLSLILTKSFSDSVGPTLDRMVTAIDDLNKFMQSKQAATTEELKSLLQNLNQSIISSLEKMGNEFNNTLTGNAGSELKKVVEAMGDNTALMGKTQLDIKALIDLAKTSVIDQTAHGHEQVERMTAVLNELMAQMSKTSGETTEAARGIIQDVSTVSSRNVEQLSKLLEKHETELTRVEGLEKVLQETLLQFNGSVPKYGQVVTDLKQVANEVNTAIALMAQTAKSIKDGQEANQSVAGLAAKQVEDLESANQKQKEVWEGIQVAMERYGNTFAEVENHAKILLAQIGQEMLTFSTTTQNHFDKLGKTANEHIGNAQGKLAASIEELGEQLSLLHESIADTVKKLQQ